MRLSLKRLFDLVCAAAGLILLSPVLLLCAIAVRLSSPGPVLHMSDRIGANNAQFKMLKFRTMRTGTPQVATHLLNNPSACLTPVGAFLRTTSLDELPQLVNVLKGEMSLVGPRPALFNQEDQIAQRTKLGVHILVPGVTGWAQVNGRDELPVPEKVRFDAEYLDRRSFWFDLHIIWLTAVKVLRREGVSH